MKRIITINYGGQIKHFCVRKNGQLTMTIGKGKKKEVIKGHFCKSTPYQKLLVKTKPTSGTTSLEAIRKLYNSIKNSKIDPTLYYDENGRHEIKK